LRHQAPVAAGSTRVDGVSPFCLRSEPLKANWNSKLVI
jgi:hypothetical protein